MAGNTASFGWLKLRYEILNDRVVISRNVWLPILLLIPGGLGAWSLVQFFSSHHSDGSLFGLGFVGVMTGLFALFMTPWLAPGKVVVTREGVNWGGTMYPVQALTAFHARAPEMQSSRYGKYSSWSFTFTTVQRKILILSLGNHRLGASKEPLANLERAVSMVLQRAPR
jgi:hypothetical protein